MALNDSSGGDNVCLPPSQGPPVFNHVLTFRKNLDSIRKLKTDAEILRQEAHAMEQVSKVEDEQSQLRTNTLVSWLRHGLIRWKL